MQKRRAWWLFLLSSLATILAAMQLGCVSGTGQVKEPQAKKQAPEWLVKSDVFFEGKRGHITLVVWDTAPSIQVAIPGIPGVKITRSKPVKLDYGLVKLVFKFELPEKRQRIEWVLSWEDVSGFGVEK